MRLEDIIQDRRIDAFKQVYPGIYSDMNNHIKNRDPLRYIDELELVKYCIPDYMLQIYQKAYTKISWSD